MLKTHNKMMAIFKGMAVAVLSKCSSGKYTKANMNGKVICAPTRLFTEQKVPTDRVMKPGELVDLAGLKAKWNRK